MRIRFISVDSREPSELTWACAAAARLGDEPPIEIVESQLLRTCVRHCDAVAGEQDGTIGLVQLVIGVTFDHADLCVGFRREWLRSARVA
jgi:hypothetical protein